MSCLHFKSWRFGSFVLLRTIAPAWCWMSGVLALPCTYLTPSAGCNDSTRLLVVYPGPADFWHALLQCSAYAGARGETSGGALWCTASAARLPRLHWRHHLLLQQRLHSKPGGPCSTISDDVGTIVNIGGEDSCAGPRGPPSSLAHAY